MSLRHNPNSECLDTYINVGSHLNGLFMRVKEKPDTPCEIIRKPRALKSSLKSFQSSPYLKTSLNFTQTLRSAGCSPLAEDLEVVGISKLPLEVEAAVSAGVDAVNYNLTDQDEYEVIIAENYSNRYLKLL